MKDCNRSIQVNIHYHTSLPLFFSFCHSLFTPFGRLYVYLASIWNQRKERYGEETLNGKLQSSMARHGNKSNLKIRTSPTPSSGTISVKSDYIGRGSGTLSVERENLEYVIHTNDVNCGSRYQSPSENKHELSQANIDAMIEAKHLKRM